MTTPLGHQPVANTHNQPNTSAKVSERFCVFQPTLSHSAISNEWRIFIIGPINKPKTPVSNKEFATQAEQQQRG